MAQDLLDIPNDRSSKTVTTQLGGRLAIEIELLLSGVVYLFLPLAPIDIHICNLLATFAFSLL